MADIPESSLRNDGISPVPSAPPAANELTKILARLARGQEAIQDTIRQLVQTLQAGAHALSSRGNMPPPLLRGSRRSQSRTTQSYSPEMLSDLERLIHASPFDHLGPRGNKKVPREMSGNTRRPSDRREGSIHSRSDARRTV